MAPNLKPHSVKNIKLSVPLVLNLEELNYDAWSALFTLHCTSVGLLHHIDGTSTKDDKSNVEWIENDNEVKIWIVGTISTNLIPRVLKKSYTAYDAWKKLEEIFMENKCNKAMPINSGGRNMPYGNAFWNSSSTGHQRPPLAHSSYVANGPTSFNGAGPSGPCSFGPTGLLCTSPYTSWAHQNLGPLTYGPAAYVSPPDFPEPTYGLHMGQPTTLPHSFQYIGDNGWHMHFGATSHLASDTVMLNSSRLASDTCMLNSSSHKCNISSLLRCNSTGSLYPFAPPRASPTALASQSTWHQRLGHPGHEVIRHLATNKLIDCNKVTEDVDPNVSSSTTTSESNEKTYYEKDKPVVPNRVAEQEPSTNFQSVVLKLVQEVKVLKGSQMKQIVKINMLEKDLVESKRENEKLKNGSSLPDSRAQSSEVDSQKKQSMSADTVYIVGGYDGSSWLSTLDSYFPSNDHKRSHRRMKFVKQYASAATSNGELYHFGGVGYHTVESFSPTMNKWIQRPPLFWKNINVAGASINGKLFVVGGEQGGQSSSAVEYLDLNIGKWLPSSQMQSKRLAPAAGELNNALYVTGGYDGVSYLSSVERLDPREEKWCKLPNMKTRKKCHSTVVLNEKLYTLGGYDGDKYVSTMETFDTRMGSWVEAESMNVSRGNFGAFVVKEKLYAIGGVKENGEILSIVECYEEGSRWEVVPLKAIGKRSHFSAIVL